jgi:DNA (cytosine-5)-methyltransferase 1
MVIADGKVRFRWMSPREYARLQGAPDFTLAKNTIQSLFGFGDGVCVPVIRWVDENVLTPVYEDESAARGAGARNGKASKNVTA